MSVLVYTESDNGNFKKNALEVASYASEVAKQLGTTVTAISINANENENLGTYGVSKVLNVSNDQLKTFNAKAYAHAIIEAAKSEGAKVVIVSSSSDTKFLAPIVAAKLGAGYAPNAV
ncbi:MAG: electron transfer flavoprotein subunit alpha/FixB family protein, partial [Maribacter sp.]|nr:electron transfer flavoprotein subunit alpha/FixB family protein [Maribacter sp.]